MNFVTGPLVWPLERSEQRPSFVSVNVRFCCVKVSIFTVFCFAGTWSASSVGCTLTTPILKRYTRSTGQGRNKSHTTCTTASSSEYQTWSIGKPVFSPSLKAKKLYRRRRQFATAATAPRIFGIFSTTILNMKPEKITKYKWLVCKWIIF